MKEKINKWFIAIKKISEDIFDLSGLTVIEPPEGFYIADPFLFGGYLFYELYDYDKGVIAFSKINDDLSIGKAKIAIKQDYHMSFPCICETPEGIFMTPETVIAGELQIWKAVRFPDKWEKIKIVAQGRYDDPVLFMRNGKLNIFATKEGDKLTVFESDTIEGEWRVSHTDDIQYSRGAGLPFEYKGRLVRPTQDWIPDYGKGIKIKELFSHDFIRTIDANWYPNLIGTHTFNFDDRYVVLDGKIKL